MEEKGYCCVPVEEPVFVSVELKEFMDLIRDSEKCSIVKNAFFSSLSKTSYGVTVNDNTVISVFKSVFPEDYWKWDNSTEEVK